MQRKKAASSLQVVSVATEVLQELDADVRRRCILAFHDIQAALLASDQLDNEICSLEDFEPASPTEILLVVGVPPMSQQVVVIKRP